MVEPLDCAIIGGGPGGLTAAIYLARFRRSSVVVDAAASRARWIPESHNCPGFPTGVSGRDYLARLKLQARACNARFESGEVTAIHRDGDLFRLAGVDGLSARKVILATGCEDVMPPVAGLADAIDCGAIRLCPVCDGFEAIDRDIAVYGPLAQAADHALFIRTFSRRVVLVPSDDHDDPGARSRLRDAGVAITGAGRDMRFDGSRCSFMLGDRRRAFDVVYSMLGTRQNADLATTLGAATDDEGALLVDHDLLTSVPGLYAIGDVVSALNQIAVATGHAAIAATHVHNALPRNHA
ncbi:FAD-dependent oxidoreductase [Lysobacter sp. F60174L2]|uniref:FAD-dependent oxidoreductase n=1 Tax=Lysobacter sp. F60174L2 TaxID=3459295 RepID=UPI00403E1FB0